MGSIKIKKGLNLPISGEPVQEIFEANPVERVALLGADYIGMIPQFEVEVGQRVKLGQVLFTDRKNPKIRFTSPGCGTVESIHRGEKRLFLSVVIRLYGEEEITFSAYGFDQLKSLSKETIESQLLQSGLWTAVRQRPFGTIADPEFSPRSIFVTAIDSNPFAPDMQKVLEGREDEFRAGLIVLSRLTEGKVFLCKSGEQDIPTTEIKPLSIENFTGPHPAGNVGTHIHFLDPVDRNRHVWHLGAQDVAAIGTLFLHGRIQTERILSLGGSDVKHPRLYRSRIGASLEELTRGKLKPGFRRIISGSVFHGYTAQGPSAFLGRYDQQVTVLQETTHRSLFGWLSPGFNLYSVKHIVASKWLSGKRFPFTTEQHGGRRAIVPVGSYEKMMPLDILPTILLRALAADDIEEAEKLGALELTEEDLALCTFVCPAKIDHGINLRRVLSTIQKEG